MSDFLDSREVYPETEYVAVSQSRIHKIEKEAEEVKQKLKIQQGHVNRVVEEHAFVRSKLFKIKDMLSMNRREFESLHEKNEATNKVRLGLIDATEQKKAYLASLKEKYEKVSKKRMATKEAIEDTKMKIKKCEKHEANLRFLLIGLNPEEMKVQCLDQNGDDYSAKRGKRAEVDAKIDDIELIIDDGQSQSRNVPGNQDGKKVTDEGIVIEINGESQKGIGIAEIAKMDDLKNDGANVFMETFEKDLHLAIDITTAIDKYNATCRRLQKLRNETYLLKQRKIEIRDIFKKLQHKYRWKLYFTGAKRRNKKWVTDMVCKFSDEIDLIDIELEYEDDGEANRNSMYKFLYV